MNPPDPNDARLRPGAYIHNASPTSPKVCMVLEHEGNLVLVEDAKTGDTFTIAPWLLCAQWKLAREAPAAPTYVEDCVAV